MSLLAALLFAAVGARAADVVAVPRLEVGVHPSLIAPLREPGAATLGLLEERARTLVSQAARGEVRAGDYLNALAASREAADRLAAGALARLAAEPALAASVTGASPSLSRLPTALTPGGPFRAAPASNLAGIHQLALAARGDAAVSALFDRSRPALSLDDAGMDGGRLRQNGKRSPWLRRGELVDAFEHRGLAGAAVEVYRRPLRHDETSPEIERAEKAAADLAAAGVGPRVLGRDVVFSRRFDADGMRVVSLRERVDGKNAHDLVRDGWVDRALMAELERALTAAARAGYDVSTLDRQHLVYGETALTGLRRALIVDAGALARQPNAPWALKAVKDWLRRFEQSADEWRRRVRNEALLLR